MTHGQNDPTEKFWEGFPSGIPGHFHATPLDCQKVPNDKFCVLCSHLKTFSWKITCLTDAEGTEEKKYKVFFT